jgi:hypothetical protein
MNLTAQWRCSAATFIVHNTIIVVIMQCAAQMFHTQFLTLTLATIPLPVIRHMMSNSDLTCVLLSCNWEYKWKLVLSSCLMGISFIFISLLHFAPQQLFIIFLLHSFCTAHNRVAIYEMQSTLLSSYLEIGQWCKFNCASSRCCVATEWRDNFSPTYSCTAWHIIITYSRVSTKYHTLCVRWLKEIVNLTLRFHTRRGV